ncbi:hypothetical protein [Kitasatospora sp. GP82]|uniref:hypothetical protein n=1 Tax=Kitasatospora sp. GP82 TaxID=3035089 RepID=UPI002476EFDA|nr:hypothetical protein [Kitasatospora sp. GP82]MDH6127416.1 hypothetical protein [Kitasatospora sp. GP82]
MTIPPGVPPHAQPDREPEPMEDFWANARAVQADGLVEGFAELAQEMRQARLDAAIPLKADDADHLIDWPRVKRAAARLKRAAQAVPNVAAIGVALAGPAWLWRVVVSDCSHAFTPAADIADPGLGLGLMALTGVLAVRRWVRGVPFLGPVTRVAAWSVVLGTLTYPPAATWAVALLIGVFR